jgi:putative Ca2+/H+ antiporter (TMEM165/GDT1 family)
MSLTAALTTFVVILPAELPDKTIFACLILASRYRPRYVLPGAAAAFLVQVAIAVAAGGALSLLPHQAIQAATAAAFLVGAVLLWRQHEDNSDEVRSSSRNAFWPVSITAFIVVFLAEFGDLTQIMTASLAAKYHDPLAVGAGAVLGLWTAATLAVVVGWKLLKIIPVHWLTRGAAAIMVVLAGTSIYAAAA